MEQEAIDGIVERITFRNEETGFIIFHVKTQNTRYTVPVVAQAFISVGENVSLKGNWERSKYGLQFKAREVTASKPVTSAGIRKYLGSGAIPGIGPKTADLIVGHFGEDTLRILDEEPERLKDIHGIGNTRLERIKAAWNEQKHVQDIMLFLAQHNVPLHVCRRIWRAYGENAIRLIRENPFRLAADIAGVGFKTADRIAAEFGIPPSSEQRIRAGLIYVMEESVGVGHCGIPKEAFISKAAETLGLDRALIAPVLEDELASGKSLAAYDDIVYLASLARCEETIAQTLLRMLRLPTEWTIDIERAIKDAEKQSGTNLADGQRKALRTMLSNRVSIMTGGPGTGKTHTLNTLLRIFLKHNIRVHLAAPTGKAAQRAQEVTGHPASTIHRLLRLSGPGAEPVELSDGVLVIDEMSMVDTWLMAKVVKAAKGISLVMVGDVDQLPSVGPGQVLYDLIRSGRIPVARLTEVFRQAAGSLIVRNAHLINKGIFPERGSREDDFHILTVRDRDESGNPIEPAIVGQRIADLVVDLVTRRIPSATPFTPRDIMVLSPMNRSSCGVVELNARLQKEINPSPAKSVEKFGTRFGVEDRIIQTTNDYELEIFNGDTGFVMDIDEEESLLVADFSGRRVAIPFDKLDAVRLAYAMTIHKSQGSQADVVVIPATTQHYTMLQRNLLYTGVTRARKLAVIVGQTRAIAMMVKNQATATRITRLAALLQAT